MKILNYGSCNIDYVYLLDHIVNVGETESSKELSLFCGGKGLNQSIAIARAGVEVFHAGCIGENGEFLLKTLKENGVNVEFLKQIDGENGHAIIQLAKSGENSIFIYHGSNAKITKEDIDKTLFHFKQGDIIVLQNEISNVEYIIEKAYIKGLKTVLNPSPISDNIKNIDLNKISYLVLNEIEAKMITGCESATTALEYFKSNSPWLSVVLTLGSYGSIYQYGDEKIYQPTFDVETKDTTAAGDTFTGYFVAEIVKGATIKTALEVASCAAAISVTRHGASPSIPKIEEVKSALKVLKPKENSLTIKILKETIESYVVENLSSASLKALAEVVGYSVVYTGKLIKKITGLSFKKFLHEKRLEKAEYLIKNTDIPIGEIIAKIGYENENYFRKIFLNKYGKNPLKYRRYKES